METAKLVDTYEWAGTIRDALSAWFEATARELPWRSTYAPYHVWLSEIMLQQTQMERGVRYFLRWIERFPDISAVAAANEREILKYWEGLGYYARARNLHKAAQIVVEEHGGRLPLDPNLLVRLPGIGPYTAAAIASIAGNVTIPVVDANVARVYARIFDIDRSVKTGEGRRVVEVLAKNMLPAGGARVYNQAVMEFGGMICLPRNPRCPACPLSGHCLARKRGTVDIRPLPEKRKGSIRIEMVTGLLLNGDRFFIQQREFDDIWGGLWEFPGGRLEEGEGPAEAVSREFFEETRFLVDVGEKIATVQHGYMHYRVILHGYFCTMKSGTTTLEPVLSAARDYRWVTFDELSQYGFPAGHRKVLEILRRRTREISSARIP